MALFINLGGTKDEYNALSEKESDMVYLVECLVLNGSGTNDVSTITKDLTGYTVNNTADEIVEGDAYTANISTKDGYTLTSIVVVMDGVYITDAVVDGVSIRISSVTGDLVITVVVKEKISDKVVYNYYFDTSGKMVASNAPFLKYNGYHFLYI